MGYYTAVYHLIPPSRCYLAESHALENHLHTLATHCVYSHDWGYPNLRMCTESFRLLGDMVSRPSRAVAAELALYTHDRCRGNLRLLDHHSELAYVGGWAHRIAGLRVRCVAEFDDWTCLVEIGDRLQAMCWGRAGATKLYRLDDALSDADARAVLAECIAECYEGYEAIVGLPAVLAALANDPWQPAHDCWFCDYELAARDAPDLPEEPLLRRLACAYAGDWPKEPTVRALYDSSASIYDGSDEPAELHLAYVCALIRNAHKAGLLPSE